jgi:opacity protein-like surface antigen
VLLKHSILLLRRYGDLERRVTCGVEGNMKKLFLGAAAAVVFGSGCGSAADLGVPVRAAAVQACPAALWAGFHVGGNGGRVIYSANRTDQDGVLGEIASYVQKKEGYVAGGQVGYNWSTCHTVLGVEADGQWASPRAITQLAPNTAGINVNISSPLRRAGDRQAADRHRH